MILKLETITKEREAKMECLWKEFQNVLSSYLKYTEEYRDEYIDLRNRDAEDTRSIQDHYNEVSKLTEKIAELKLQLTNVKDEQDFNINQLIKHRNDLKLKMDKIKEDMENRLIDDKEKLKFLALMGSKTYKKGKTIIQLMQLCENMEMDHQKAVDRMPKKKTFLNYSEEELKTPPSPLSEEHHMYDKLEKFWMRYNRTRIDCACLQEEKMSLQKQNKELKMKLKEYLVTVNMTNGQPAQKNERFANRPSSMKIEKIEHIAISSKNQLIKNSKKDKRPVTCIEGNLSIAVRQMKISNFVQRVETCYAVENKL
ncbi:CLUMA_CG016481, isoform A [Clunio marinus]|uniref:CLUMA_CG016481, isoform A n=1 Tax=Clunio marinus TaxID=568069 RepID=A0A1J1IS75_9DIPT|nr:CLUMA_CG016481, isoform A [Clunio marinus]